MDRPRQIMMQAIPDVPEIRPGTDLARTLATALRAAAMAPADGDIIVIAHKVVSKAEGRVIRLDGVEPSPRARDLSRQLGKDPRKVEVILAESDEVVRAVKPPHRNEGLLITRHRLGFVCANAGVDESNVGAADTVIALPRDPDASARCLRAELAALTGVPLGVVISDTFGRAWRLGHVNVAIGIAGIPAFVDLAGQADAYGRALRVTAPALADELAAATGLLMAKDAMTPAVLVRGVAWRESEQTAADLVRPATEDLFP